MEGMENRDTAIFEICGVTNFTAKELRENIKECMEKVSKLDPHGDIQELQQYAKEFLIDVNETYSENKTQEWIPWTKKDVPIGIGHVRKKKYPYYRMTINKVMDCSVKIDDMKYTFKEVFDEFEFNYGYDETTEYQPCGTKVFSGEIPVLDPNL